MMHNLTLDRRVEMLIWTQVRHQGQVEESLRAETPRASRNPRLPGLRQILIFATAIGCLALALFVYAALEQPRAARIAWAADIDSLFVNAIHLRPGGGVVAAGDKQIVYFDVTGNKERVYGPQASQFSFAVFDGAENLYAGGSDGWVYSLDPQGNERWKVCLTDESIATTRYPTRTCRVTLPDGKELLAITTCGELVRMDLDGNILKRAAVNLELGGWNAPLALPGGQVVAMSPVSTRGMESKAVCLDFDGEVLWEYGAPGRDFFQMHKLGDRIVLSHLNTKVVALDFNGREVWSFENPDPSVHPSESHAYWVRPWTDSTVAIENGGDFFEVDSDGNILQWHEFQGYINAIRIDNNKWYASVFQVGPIFKLRAQLEQMDRWEVLQFVSEHTANRTLVLHNGEQVLDVQSLPASLRVQCGPGPEGELYGFSQHPSHAKGVPSRSTIYRIDP